MNECILNEKWLCLLRCRFDKYENKGHGSMFVRYITIIFMLFTCATLNTLIMNCYCSHNVLSIEIDWSQSCIAFAIERIVKLWLAHYAAQSKSIRFAFDLRGGIINSQIVSKSDQKVCQYVNTIESVSINCKYIT